MTQWGKGIEQLAKLFYRFGGRAHLERFLAPIQLRLLSKGNRFHVDTSDLLRGDSDSIQKMTAAMAGNAQTRPTASMDELRRVQGLPRDSDGPILEPMSSTPPEPVEPEPEPTKEPIEPDDD